MIATTGTRPDSPLGHARQIPPILLPEITRRTPDVQFEHPFPRVHIGQGDVNSFLEPPLDGRVELPRNVGSAQYEDTGIIVAYSLHLPGRRIGTMGNLVSAKGAYDHDMNAGRVWD